MKHTKNKTSQSILKTVFTLITLVVLVSSSISRGNGVEKVNPDRNALVPSQPEDLRYKDFCIKFIRLNLENNSLVKQCIEILEKYKPLFLDFNIAEYFFHSSGLFSFLGTEKKLERTFFIATHFSLDTDTYRTVCQGYGKVFHDFESVKSCRGLDLIKLRHLAKQFDPETLSLESKYSGGLEKYLSSGNFEDYFEEESKQKIESHKAEERHNQGSECGDSDPDSGSNM